MHRPAVPGDFFPRLAEDAAEDAAQTHDETADDLEPALEAEVDEDDGLTEAERITEAMKNAWAAWGLQYNAAVRAAERLDAGQPPDEPELN